MPTRPLFPASMFTLVGLAVGLAGGCARYHALPLDARADQRALASPDMERITRAASRIQHPLLKPVHLAWARGLTPDQIAVAAVLGNPELRAVRDQRRVAQAQLLQAGLLPDPELSLEQERPTAGSPPDVTTGHSAQVGWPLSALWERGLQRRIARDQAGAVDLGIAWKEWQVAQAARLAAYELLALEVQAPLERQALAEARAASEALESAVRAGAAGTAEAAPARLAFDQERQRAQALAEALAQARQHLNGLLGLPPDAPTPLRAGVPLPGWQHLPSMAALLQGLGERRLDLLAFRQAYASRDAAYRLAVREQFPAIGILVGRALDPEGVATLSLGASLSLPFFNRNQGRIAGARASRRAIHDEFQARLFEARAQIAQILTRLGSMDAQIDAARDALGPLAATAQAYHAGLKAGTADRLADARAQMACLDQELLLARLQAERAALGIQLELASGAYLPGDGTTETKGP